MYRLYIAAVAAVFVLAGCDSQETQSNDGRRGARDAAPVRIIAHKVAYVRQETRVEAVGTARARASAILYPETGGAVTEILFRAGAFAEEGAPLVRLEDSQERLAVRLAEVAVKEAEQLLARYRRIEDTGAVSDSQIDEAQTALEAARIQLEQAEVALAERTITAPFAGYLGLTDIDPGARITPTTAITQLDDRRVLYVDFQAPEQVFARVQVGDTVEAAPFAEPDRTYAAEVINVDSRIDPDRRSFTVRAALDNASDILRPGMSFQIAVTFEGEAYPAVPEAAIIWGSDGSYVWTVREGAARQVPVTIISREKGQVLVRGDIPEGSLVVAEGVQKVREGTQVTDIGGAVERSTE